METHYSQTTKLYWTLKPSFSGYAEFFAGGNPDHLTTGWGAWPLSEVIGTDDFAAALAEYAATYSSGKLGALAKDHEAAVASRALRALAETRGKACYVRFGKLPKGGVSVNHRDNIAEPGVSVYKAYKLTDRYVVDLAGVDSGSALFIIGTAQMYEVTGTMVGTGSDGEPCLADCKARKVAGGIKIEVIF